MNAYRAMKLNQGEAIGDANDIRGMHVTMSYQGLTLLGEIFDQQFLTDDVDVEGWAVRVRHFNGKPWPGCEWIVPARLTVLPRDEEEERE